MSSLLVLGGSGRTGAHVLEHAAQRGHHVRALVRNPDKVQAPAGVELIQGNPANIDDIRRAAEGTEAVISTLARRLLTSFIAWPMPSPPQRMRSWPMRRRIGSTRAMTASSPPSIRVEVPAIAWSTVLPTGESIMSTFLCANFAPTRRVVAGSIVLMST